MRKKKLFWRKTSVLKKIRVAVFTCDCLFGYDRRVVFRSLGFFSVVFLFRSSWKVIGLIHSD